MTRLAADPDGPGSWPEVRAYIQRAIEENCIMRPEGAAMLHPTPEGLSRAIAISVFNRLGIDGSV